MVACWQVQRRLDCVDPGRSLVVEDSVNGLLAAQAAGAFRVGVTNSLPACVLSQHADLVVDHLDAIPLDTLVPGGGGAAG